MVHLDQLAHHPGRACHFFHRSPTRRSTPLRRSGNRTAYRYQVHSQNGEYYWGEYFFNGELYSVTYIYR